MTEWNPLESAPTDQGRYIQVQQTTVYRWAPYNPASKQYRSGLMGRWQRSNGFGDWENAPLTGTGWRDLPAN